MSYCELSVVGDQDVTRLVSEIGWDELLKTRSAVSMMEEEYRMQKSQADLHNALRGEGESEAQGQGDAVIHEDWTALRAPRPRPRSVWGDPNHQGVDRVGD